MSIDLSSLFQNKELLQNIIATIALLMTTIFIRMISIRSIHRAKTIPTEHRRQWIVKIKTILLFIFLIGLLVIWAQELQAFAVSLVAVAAAIVIATKELIMNLSGYFARASSKPFSVGDRIEIDGIRGDVIDQNLFFTQVLEIGPGHLTHQYTGRSISFPNSVFVGATVQPIINESFIDHYTLHVFQVPISRDSRTLYWQDVLLKICNDTCAEFIDNAKSSLEQLGHSQGIEPPSVDPRVQLHFPDHESVSLIVRIPAPIQKKGRIEQEILKKFTVEYVNIKSPE